MQNHGVRLMAHLLSSKRCRLKTCTKVDADLEDKEGMQDGEMEGDKGYHFQSTNSIDCFMIFASSLWNVCKS